MGNVEEVRSEQNLQVLAAQLRGAAIELLHGRVLDAGPLAVLLEAAATALLGQAERRVDSVPVPLSTVERLAAIKKRHRRAYERWTPEEDASLSPAVRCRLLDSGTCRGLSEAA